MTRPASASLGRGPVSSLEDIVTLLDWRTRRRDYRDNELAVDELVWAWRNACIGAGLSNTVQVASGITDVVPKIVDVTLGPPTVLIVELLPSQLASDVRGVAHRVAGSLGSVALRVEPRGLRHVRVELLAADPLVGLVERARPVSSAHQPVTIGRDEQGDPVPIALGVGAHLIVQGSSGSGKTTGTYGFLAQLAPARDVLVVGSDVTGLTLAPWAPRAPGWCALGTRNLDAHIRVLERAVREMDDRVEQMPPGHDSIPINPELPLILMVIEEFPGLIRLLSTADAKLEKRARALLGRLFGESRKAGMRLLVISQRADANLVGGFERDQCSHGISFRVGGLSALQMLHPDTDKGIAAEHATARPGVALLTAPGVPLRRFRAPLTTYQQYCAEVIAAAATDGKRAA